MVGKKSDAGASVPEAEAIAFAADPDAALRDLPEPVLLDEWQAVPGVLGAVKRAVDADSRPGRFLLTGSVRAGLENAVWPGTGRIVRVATTRACRWTYSSHRRACSEPGDTTSSRSVLVPPRWYTLPMATANPRVQVTVDPELGEALRAVDPHPASKSRLIRDLALRGAEVAEEERGRREAAIEVLCKIADGEIPYDFEALGEIIRERHEMHRTE